mmetsp:Transcript_55555/g.162365  ORF Transcript_55555/g.162365 Transcript_55555/m.162365 type:complete len:864 (-) Transcript_55555:52-2643(-)
MSRSSRTSSRALSISSASSEKAQDNVLLYDSEEHTEPAEDVGWCCQEHTDFSHHMFLAVRVSFGTCLVILPLLIREHTSTFVDALRGRGIIMRSDVAMYLYTVYMSTGETLELAWSALCGTFLSVFNLWIMEGIFPGGYTKDSPQFVLWALVANGVVVTFLVLYMNLAMNTRIFCLSSFVWHFMAMLNPNQDTGFSHGFSLDFSSLEIKEFKAASIGCMIAILTTMLPWPFWAHKRASAAAERLVSLLDFTWQECTRLMCLSEVDHYVQDSVSTRMLSLQSDLAILSSNVTNSWWEDFCRPRSANRRKMLSRLHAMLAMSYDDLSNVWQNCLAETYGDMHTRFMDLIGNNVNVLISEAGVLLKASTRVACLGHLDENVAEELMEQRDRTRDAIAALTTRFLEVKRQLQQEVIDKELVDEHCFCLNACTYGRVISEFAEALVDHANGAKPLPGAGATGGRLFSYACSKDQMDFAVRNFITIMLGMFVGWHGYYNRFRPYDAGIACTLAILLSDYSGSALAKNLQRIQGVVIGTVLGQLVYALLAWCSVEGYLALVAAQLLWVWFTFFIYFHIPAHSTIACLLGVFGVSNMIGVPLKHVGCSSLVVEKAHLAESYYDIVNVCTALALSSAVDMILGKSAKAKASDAIMDVWRELTKAITSILDPDEPTTRVKSGEIIGNIASARKLGAEASKELSILRPPWRATDFDHAVDATLNLRVFLDSLESTAAQGVDGGCKDPDFLKATQLESFAPIRGRLIRRMQLVEATLHSCFCPHPDSEKWSGRKQLKKLSSMHLRSEASEIDDFLREATTVAWEASADASLENDGPSQVCALLAGVEAMQREVRQVHRRLMPSGGGGGGESPMSP